MNSRVLFINILAFMVIGGTLASLGTMFDTLEYWLIIGSTVVVQINSGIQ